MNPEGAVKPRLGQLDRLHAMNLQKQNVSFSWLVARTKVQGSKVMIPAIKDKRAQVDRAEAK
jgi:hypothetical protein